MKAFFKTLITGLALAFISSPLLAATSPIAANSSQATYSASAASGSAVTRVANNNPLDTSCTLSMEVGPDEFKVTISVTADTYQAAWAELMSFIKKMLQEVFGGQATTR
jgi:hypothetical protein